MGSPSPAKKKSLPLQEWFLLLVVLGFLATLVIISSLSRSRIKGVLISSPPQIEKEIIVQIDGEVANPGSYPVPSGTPLEKILKRAKPKRNADLSSFKIEEKLVGPCEIHIPKLEKIIVTIEGAVLNPGRLEVPVNSRVKDLKGRIVFLEGPAAQAAISKKRRLLKHGEVIHIPFGEKKE